MFRLPKIIANQNGVSTARYRRPPGPDRTVTVVGAVGSGPVARGPWSEVCGLGLGCAVLGLACHSLDWIGFGLGLGPESLSFYTQSVWVSVHWTSN